MREFVTEQGVYEAGANDVLGKGTYGTVYRVRLRGNPSIKKAVKTFCPETLDENEGVPSTTLREVNAVKSVNHPNIMSVEEVVIPTTGPLTEMFVVMELCKGTLKEKVQDMISRFLRGDSKWTKPNSSMKLPNEYVREAKLVAWQILNAVAVCHSRGIMHRDLKPANILWAENDLLKIGDFGLARFVRGRPMSIDHLVPQTGEVQTMWYRAPEVLLGDENYGMLVDDWSVGCVIAELFRFRMSISNQRMESDPLFAGRGDVHTLLLIFEAVGTPRGTMNDDFQNQRVHNNTHTHTHTHTHANMVTDDDYLKGLPFWSDDFPNWTPGTLREKVQLLDEQGFDLVTQLLALSPMKRKASRFLLNHPWFDDVKEIVSRSFIPWYRGCEKDFLRLLEIDRLPPAQALPSAPLRGATTTASSSASNRQKRPTSLKTARSQETQENQVTRENVRNGAQKARSKTTGQ